MATVQSTIAHPGVSGARLNGRAQDITLSGLSGHTVRGTTAEVGQGPTYVFLHGLVGLNEHWDAVINAVCHRLRCVCLELPLLTLTGEDCSIRGVTALTVRFLEERMGGPVCLVGNSFGGHVALKIAHARPDLVSALVLAGSSGLIERNTIREIMIRPSKDWVRKKIAELFHDPARSMRDVDVDRAYAELTDRRGARAMVKLSRSARGDHMGDLIHEIKAPTLILWGKQDVVTPPEAAQMFLGKMPDARIAWFDQCGHAPMMECPDQFAQAMLSFADELVARGAGAAGGAGSQGDRAGTCQTSSSVTNSAGVGQASGNPAATAGHR